MTRLKSDIDIRNSSLVPVTRDDVRDEYQRAARLPTAHERGVWGSYAAMTGRFRFGLEQLDWSRVRRWLDLGCGEAGFFAMAEDHGRRFSELVGIDLTPAMIDRARQVPLHSPALFAVADLLDAPTTPGGYHLVTLLGVLQKCAVDAGEALRAAADRLAPGGQLYLTTTNRAWQQFSDSLLQPHVGHSWYHPNDLADHANRAGLEVITLAGLDAPTAQQRSLTDSQTLTLIARRR